MMDIVSFTRMADGSAADYELISRKHAPHAARMRAELQRYVMQLLREAEEFDLGYPINRMQHSLQTATRAFRDGVDEETVVVALLHDIGDGVGTLNHSDFAASLLRPFISERNYWIVRHHGLFQGYYYFHHQGGNRNARDQFRDHPHYQACVDFCEHWDQCSFDPHYDTMPLQAFEPMVAHLFAKEPRGFE